MTQEKFEKLKTLGRPSDNWQDYLRYGFTNKDIGQLLAIVKKDTIINCDKDNDEPYESIHAWRVLGQLGDNAIIEPLIDMLNQYSLSDNDWAISGIPKVFAMIGEASIEPLARFMRIKTHEEFARVMASDGLREIAILNETLRDRIISAYDKYLQNPDKLAYALNSLTICSVMDLKAKELLEPIAKMFKDDCVDISICGNMDDVEMACGVRIKRLTVKPKHDKLMFQKHVSENEVEIISSTQTETTQQEIDKYLNKYTNEHSIKNFSSLDGYFAALICSDKQVLPSQWSLEIWGGKESQSKWQNYQEFETFNNLIYDHYRLVELQIEHDKYQANISNDIDLNKKIDWCVGFMQGMHHWQKSPEDFAMQTSLHYSIIAILANDDKQSLIQELNFGITSQNCAEIIGSAVASIYQAMHEEDTTDYDEDLIESFASDIPNNDYYYPETTTPYIREGKKIGRNEPCPCGSGKKYKKCCINK